MSLTGRIRLLLVPLAAALAVASATGAAASPLSMGSGTFTTTSAQFVHVRSAGATTIVDPLVAHLTYTGTFSGTSVVQGILIFHPDGSATFHDVETFTGTVDGIPGTVTFSLDGGSTPDGAYHGTDVIVRGTGGLASLHGVMRQVGTVAPPQQPPLGTYTAQLLFDNR